MQSVRRLIILTPLLFALGTGSALAQGIFEINPFIGYRTSGDGELELLNRTGTFNLDGGISGGIAGNLTFHDLFQFEFSWTRQATQLSVESQDITEASIDYYQGGVVALFRQPGQTLRPFVVGTLGTATFRPKDSRLDNSTNFAGSLGVGLKAYVSERVGVRFEFRGFTTETDLTRYATICDPFVCSREQSSQSVWQGEVRAGVMIMF